MPDWRVGLAATVLTVVAIADTVLPTPEDAFPLMGWVDEVALWGLSMKFWVEYLSNTQFEKIFES